MDSRLSVTPVTIAAGALTAQVSILAILFVGSLMLRHAEWGSQRLRRERSEYYSFGWLILGFALCTLGPILFSDTFATVWRPLLGRSDGLGLTHGNAMLIVFVFDIVCVTVLVSKSGGSQASPFQAMYFLLPALAIFLREPLGRLVLYLVLITGSFSYLMFRPPPRSTWEDDQGWFRGAYWFIAVASFVLATYIGYMTRPV